MTDEVFTLDEACSFLKISTNTCYAWIKSGRLRAGRTGRDGRRGDYRLLKSDCIESVCNRIHNSKVNAVGEQDKGLVCQSSNEETLGTVISLRRVGSELDSLLGQKTNGKRRNCMTD